MKKVGFTLAEVMIAMSLIGVIASLTIPTFVSSNRNKVNAAKLSTLISSVENAFTSMIAGDAVQDLSETQFASSPTETNLGKYLVLSGTVASIPSYKSLDGTTSIAVANTTANFQTKNGALLFYTSKNPADDKLHPDYIGTLVIDVNGTAKPNRWGRDVFLFIISNDGILYPAGGEKYQSIKGDKSPETCEKTTGKGCTARLINNNYEPNY